MKERFKATSFRENTRHMIGMANDIIEELEAMGYRLTLRQLFYQLVSKDIIANKQSEYKRLGSILSDARLAGLIDWHSIEDRTRFLKSVPHWDKPSDIIDGAAHQFRVDKWLDQDYHIEVWVEKDALVGVLEKACRPLDVCWFSCRGYTSQTATYDAGKRIKRVIESGKTPVIIHLGDHDPSGIDMTRDIFERIQMFAENEVEISRIALNYNQVQQYDPPPNPAKEADTRFDKYVSEYGEECWELDALNPQVIDKLITDKVLEYRDEEKWADAVVREENMRHQLRETSNRWQEIAALMALKPGEYRIAKPLKKRKAKGKK